MSSYYQADPTAVISTPGVTGTTGTYASTETVGTTSPGQDEPDTAYSVSIVNGLLLAFIIGLILVGLFFLFFYLDRTQTNANALINLNTTGDACAGQTCGAGFYCNGNGVCLTGSGDGSGTSCGSTSDCMFGLTCLPSTRVCGVEPNVTPVSNFSLAQLTTTVNGTKHYLMIETPISSSTNTAGGLNTSFLSPTLPANYSFSYDHSKGLSFDSTDPTYQGKFVSWGTTGQLTISDKDAPDIRLIQLASGEVRMVNRTCNDGQPLYRVDSGRPTPEPSSAVDATIVSTTPGVTAGTSGLTSNATGSNNFTVSRVTGRSVRGTNCSTGTTPAPSGGTTVSRTTATTTVPSGGTTVTGTRTTVSGMTVPGTTVSGTQTSVSVNSGNISGTPVLKPFTAFFPRPAENSSISSKCPATWAPITNSRVIGFTIEYLPVPLIT